MEKGLSTRKNSELKVAKALQKSYEEVFPWEVMELFLG
jgi:hypothetical protein